ncbi:hypothetical protein [Altererythrobacter sp. GH1-8]|uniref:hypothetical protein n=1 Tax=Altererythrobacter sp. GH1-8 TaxID=3349333 RepID=UPI00374DAA3C
MNRFVLLFLLLGLAACSDDPQQRSEDGDLEAKGEILGGTISDDMLPLESVASQSPPMEGEEERLAALGDEGAEETGADETSEEGDETTDQPVPPSAAPDEADEI